MKLSYSVALSLFTLEYIASESTKEPPKDGAQTTIYKISLAEQSTPISWDLNRDMKSLWIYRPPSLQSQSDDDLYVQNSEFKEPRLLTKLAKPYNTFGVDPYFSKDQFEPFERRSRPVTLVAFRRNRFIPRRSLNVRETESAEVAELQSPYNEIGNLWQEEPDVFSV